MKKFFPILATLACALILWGCPQPTPEPVEEDVLTPIKTEYNIGPDASEFSISFKTNLTCSVRSDVAWLTAPTKTKAATTETVTIKAAANNSTETRTGHITIEGGKLSATITVNQGGAAPSIVIDNTSFPGISADGGTITVDVTSNVELQVSSNVDWIKSAGNNKFTVEANEGTTDRTGTITFTGGGITKTVTVTQNGKKSEEQPYINVSPTSFNVLAAGGAITPSISSNVAYETTISAGWVTKSGDGFAVAENTTTEERTATITLKYGDITKTITVKQAGKQDVVEDDVLVNGGSSTFTVPAAGETIEVVVRSNVEYTVEIEAGKTWITQTKTRTVREDKLHFVVEANEVEEARTAKITFKYGSDLSFEVTVLQNAYTPEPEDPILEVSPSELTAPADGGELSFNVTANYAYDVDIDADWVTVAESGGPVCTLTVGANPATEVRSTMIRFVSEGMDVYVTIVQAAAESDVDPFDVGPDLSVNGTANCYVVTTAGDFSFDASVMGNGPDGLIWDDAQLDMLHLWPETADKLYFANHSTKPAQAIVIWDDNEVITNVKYNKDSKRISFTATGKKGNALIGLYDRVTTPESVSYNEAAAYWSWHIWCTDAPKHVTQYDVDDNKYVLLDRNLGATSANPEDGRATWGYHYAFGRKDPIRGYVGMAAHLKTAAQSMRQSVEHPTEFYDLNQKTCEWFNNSSSSLATVTADLWGNPFMRFCSTWSYGPPPFAPATRNQLTKTIYDPCPPGYMVPPESTWNAVDKREDITLTEDGIIISTPSGDSFYPFSGYLSPLNTTEVGQETKLGWFAFKGSTYNGTHGESLFAGAYSSCTGYVPLTWNEHRQVWEYGPDLASSYYYAFYMFGAIYGSDAHTFDNLVFDSKGTRPRVYGNPVRCVKFFDD